MAWKRDALGDSFENAVTGESVTIADVGGGYDVDYEDGKGQGHITIARDVDDFDEAYSIAVKYVKSTASYKADMEAKKKAA